METCVEPVEDDVKEASATGIGSVVAPREVTVIPVPYVGNERPVVITRPAISRFMVEKPA